LAPSASVRASQEETVEIVHIVVVALAARAAVDAWLHPGGIFEPWRERIDEWGQFDPFTDGTGVRSPANADVLRYRIAQLLLCRFCLTYHVGAIMLVIYMLSHASAWLGFLAFVVKAFAAAGAANILLTLTEKLRGSGTNLSGADPETSGQSSDGDDGVDS
jgi:hypothetical protein